MTTRLLAGDVRAMLATLEERSVSIERERAERLHPAARDAVATARQQLSLLDGAGVT